MPPEDDLAQILRSIPWFPELQPDQIMRLQAIARLIEINPGEVIFYEGDMEDFVFILLDGQVDIEMAFPGQERFMLYTAQANDIVGWSSVAPVVRQRTATARSVAASRLLAIDAAKLRELWEDDHHLGYIFTRRLVNVIATRLLLTRLQMAEYFGHQSTI